MPLNPRRICVNCGSCYDFPTQHEYFSRMQIDENGILQFCPSCPINEDELKDRSPRRGTINDEYPGESEEH